MTSLPVVRHSARLALAAAVLGLVGLGWAGAASAQGVCTDPYVCPAPDSAYFPNTSTTFASANPTTMTVVPTTNAVIVPATNAVVVPANSAAVAPGTTVVEPISMTAPSPEPAITVGFAPSYSLSGSYCTLPDGGQMWVPAGADPASMGC
jgi:hypothetical protein